MTSRRWAVTGAVVATLLGVAAVPSARAVPDGCGLEASGGIATGAGATLSGDLTVTDPGGRLRLGARSRVDDGTVATGDVVVLGPEASAFDVVRGTLLRGSGAVVRGEERTGTFPAPKSCDVPVIACGGQDVRVEKGGVRVLGPGSYGDVVLGDRADLIVLPGAYAFCSLRTGRGVAIVFSPGDPTVVGVAGDVKLGSATAVTMPPDAGTPVPTFLVTGTRVTVSGRADVDAVLRAPSARLTVGAGATITGAACAADLRLGSRVTFRCDQAAPATTTLPTSTSTTTSTLAATTSTTTAATTSTTTTSAPATTTSTATLPATTSSTIAGSTSSTSTSSTTTSTQPGATTTTSTEPGATTTSSTTSTSTTSSTSTSTSPVGCGNGVVNAGETCDDGNNSDNDSCPADCRIDACTPVTTSTRRVSVQFEPPPGGLVAGMTVLVDYPEGQVDLPGNATSFPSGTISGVPSGSSISVNDLNFNGKGHAVRITIAGPGGNALTPGQIIRLKFQDCQGATVPTADAFLCSVVSATDPFLNKVSGVRCFVVLQ